MTLNELIATLQQRAGRHGDAQCQFWISDERGHVMSAKDFPTFTIDQDAQRADWLLIEMKGERQDA
jgi:hypothetical protein